MIGVAGGSLLILLALESSKTEYSMSSSDIFGFPAMDVFGLSWISMANHG